ncbi:MAG: leucine-rich repeat domain-containing protein [Promethearchaeota archaeon]
MATKIWENVEFYLSAKLVAEPERVFDNNGKTLYFQGRPMGQHWFGTLQGFTLSEKNEIPFDFSIVHEVSRTVEFAGGYFQIADSPVGPLIIDFRNFLKYHKGKGFIRGQINQPPYFKSIGVKNPISGSIDFHMKGKTWKDFEKFLLNSLVRREYVREERCGYCRSLLVDLGGDAASQSVRSCPFCLSLMDNVFAGTKKLIQQYYLGDSNVPGYLEQSIGTIRAIRFLSGINDPELIQEIEMLWFKVRQINPALPPLQIGEEIQVDQVKIKLWLQFLKNFVVKVSESYPNTLLDYKENRVVVEEACAIRSLNLKLGREIPVLESFPETSKLGIVIRGTHVVGACLQGMKLGTVPPELHEFTDLEKLNIENTHSELLPDWMEDLEKLKVFRGGSNDYKIYLPVLTNLKSLENLDLSLSGIPLPENIGDLENLRELYWMRNNSQRIPPSIKNLQNLETVWLSENSLNTIPEEFCELNNLKMALLRGNALSSLPEEIGKLQKLENLSLRNNNIRRLPSSILECRSLKNLEIYGNPIAKTKDKTMKALLKRLKKQGVTIETW